MIFEGPFDEFLKNVVNLSPSRLSDLRARVATIEQVLRDTDNPHLVVIEARPQGSLAQKTIINPCDAQRGFDADLLVEVEDRFVSPKVMLDTVEDVLCASKRHADLIRKKKRCVTVEYKNKFHIDVVPCVRRGGDLYIGNQETGEWEATDPDGYTTWLWQRDSFTNGYLVPTVRLCKYLRDYKGRPAIKSVILTTELARRVEETSSFRRSEDYSSLPQTLVHLLGDLAGWAEQFQTAPYLTEPTCGAELRLDDTNWSAFTSQVRSLADRALAALVDPNEEASLGKWRNLFGDRFPAPAVRTPTTSLATTEQDLYRDYGIPTQIASTVTIQANVRRKDGFRFGPLSELGPLSKGRELDFTINTAVSEPFDVYWKVRNTGHEAAQVDGGLRGEIRRDNNTGHRAHRYEQTAYTGDHYVEVYIVKDNVCVARARQAVRIG